MDYETANFIVLIINTFMCLSSPLNLAVYCGMSNQFREQFTKILAGTCGALAPLGTDLGPLVSVQLTVTQVQPRAAFSSPVSPVALVREPQCPYLGSNTRLFRRETSV